MPDAWPTPAEALQSLKEGNARFAAGRAENPHADRARLELAGRADQAEHTYATIVTCSDSRVPVEILFDAGVMDLFVVRVIGNACDAASIASMEYGLVHVRTPVLVVLGHTQCGAITAATHAVQGRGHEVAETISPVLKGFEPAVRAAMEQHPGACGDDLVPHAVEENVRATVAQFLRRSAAARDMVARDEARVVGAVYDVATGRVRWLPEDASAGLGDGA